MFMRAVIGNFGFQQMNKIPFRRVIGGLLIIFLVVAMASFVGKYRKNNQADKLNELKHDPAIDVIYPNSTELFRNESPEHYAEGSTSHAVIRILYGSNDQDPAIEEFYKNKFSDLGFSYLGGSAGRLYTYRRFSFLKDTISVDMGFWFHDDFENQFRSVDISKFKAVYELVF